EYYGRDARAGKQASQPAASMIAIPEDQQEGDQINNQGDDLPRKMRDRRLFFLFEIKIPHVTIDQCHNDGGTQNDQRSTDMITKIDRHAVSPQRGVKCE